MLLSISESAIGSWPNQTEARGRRQGIGKAVDGTRALGVGLGLGDEEVQGLLGSGNGYRCESQGESLHYGITQRGLQEVFGIRTKN